MNIGQKMSAAGASLLLIIAVTLGACGRQHGETDAGQSATTPATALTPRADPADRMVTRGGDIAVARVVRRDAGGLVERG